MSYVKYFVFLIFLMVAVLLFSDDNDQNKFIGEFHEKKMVFSKVKDLICSLDEQVLPIRVKANEIEDKILRDYLNELNVSSVDADNNYNQCHISLFRYGSGFGFSGYSYKFRFNVENPIFLDDKNGNSKKHRADFYDMDLADGWVLTFKQT